MSELDVFTALLTASLILMIWGVMYKENKFYRIAEHLALGSFLGYTVYIAWDTLYNKTLVPLVTVGGWSYILVTIFGIMLWMRLVPRIGWIARWPLAVLAGIAMGVGTRGAVSAQLIGQTVVQILSPDPATTIGNIVLVVFTIGTVVFFLYTREQKGPQRWVAQIGRLALMVTFGVVMGTFLMGNLAFPIGQMPDLVTWPGYLITAIAMILIAVDVVRGRQKKV
jgi:hypothetical protein